MRGFKVIMKKVCAWVVLALGVFSGALFFKAGQTVELAGAYLTLLRSVGGETVAEAYYQRIGEFGIAYSLFAYAMGIGVIMLSIGIWGVLLPNGMQSASVVAEKTGD